MVSARNSSQGLDHFIALKLDSSELYIYIYIYIYTVMAKNIGTLGKYDQRRMQKLICIVNPFDLLFKTFTKSNLSLDNKNLKWGEISL